MVSDNRINWLIIVTLIGYCFYLLAPALTPFIAVVLLAYIGNRIGLHSVIVFFLIVASGQLFGFFDILPATLIAAILSVLVRFIYDKYLAEHQPTAIEENLGDLIL
jgi:predicted PurR-regulated permease PerM